MKIEVVEFYPLEKNDTKEILTGTLRIKLVDVGIHILGIYVSKKKESWCFMLPGKTGIRHETGVRVRYPALCFESKNQQDELMAAIKIHGRAFIENRITDKGGSLIWPERQQKAIKVPSPQPDSDKSLKPKETAPKMAVKAVMREYVDLPPRKMPFTRRASSS